jgi:hypothetical protein
MMLQIFLFLDYNCFGLFYEAIIRSSLQERMFKKLVHYNFRLQSTVNETSTQTAHE